MKINIKVFGQSVVIQALENRAYRFIKGFIEKYYTHYAKSYGGKESTPVVFAGILKKEPNIFILLHNQFKHLMIYAKENGEEIVIEEKEDLRNKEPTKANMKVREKWKLREDQVPVSEFILNNPVGTRLIPIATGSGKTFISMYSIAKIGHRLGIIILPTFIDKWVGDITEIHDTTPDKVMVVKGAKSVTSIVAMARDGNLDYDYFIFSNRTMQEFVKQYQEDSTLCEEMYGCSPLEFMSILGIGVLLVDESHMHFHSVFLNVLYADVKYHIGLSATLMSEDPVISRVQNILYPNKVRYADKMIKKYNEVYAISYRCHPDSLKKIRTSNYGSNSYSHMAFEKSILKRSSLLSRYIEIIEDVLVKYYLEDYQDKDKCLIFVSTIDMATRLSTYLAEKYPDKVVNRYCEDDTYEMLLEGDIVVSTPGSSGTAVDIPNLVTVIQTVSISSSATNIQNLGRLRQIKGRTTRFCYIYCENIPRQVDYSYKRKWLFKNRVASIADRVSSKSL